MFYPLNFVIENYENENYLERENDLTSLSLESLITSPLTLNINDDKEVNNEKTSIIDFKLKNMNKLLENILYYCSSPETLLNYKNNIDEESNYEFYKDLDCENFLLSQKKINKIISSISKSDFNTLFKHSKLRNYYNFYSKNSFINNDSKITNSNFIRKKLEEFTLFYINEIDENKILTYLNELKDEFQKNKIDMQSLGLTLFNYIENSLCLILNLIRNKLTENKNLNNFLIICIDILESFKSTNLYFFIIKFIKDNKISLESSSFEDVKEKIHFIPNNIMNFYQISSNINKKLITDLKKLIKDKNSLNLNDYWTLNYDDILFMFIKSFDNKFLLFLKFNLIDGNLIDEGKIELFANEKENKMIDIIITIKKEFIYVFYITEKIINIVNYFLIYQIYNKYTMNLINKNEIEFEKSFFPSHLFTDFKYLYCFSNNNQVFMIKKNTKLNDKKYINCLVEIYDKNLKKSKETNINNFKMNNFLCINNLFTLDNNIENKKYISKIERNKNDNYILKIYELEIDNIYLNQQSIIKITYNDNRFIITVLDDLMGLSYNIISKNYNNFIDKGILLLPFATNINNENFSQNIYEYLIEQYSLFLNVCGNFDLVNNITEVYLIKYPFSFCCNFDSRNLEFIIKCIIENDDCNYEKYYHIIILKQTICSLFNIQIFEEEKIKDLIPYFKKLIMNNIQNNQNKLFNKILKEIIIISSYLKNIDFINFNDIKFALDNNYKNIKFKTKLLIIELLLIQNKTQIQKEIFNYIIQLEKNYLINIFKNQEKVQKNYEFDLSFYSISKTLMINASEILFKKYCNAQNDLSYLIPDLSNSIQEICELYSQSLNDNNNSFNNFSFIYNSFIFRAYYFILEKLISNMILLKEKEKIFSIYKTILILDKININNQKYKYYDMDNIIEITNYNLIEVQIDNFFIENKDINLPIKIKEPKNIIIKYNIPSDRQLNNSFNIRLINKDNETHIVNLSQENDYIYSNIKEINVTFLNNIVKKNFILNFIPIKNEKNYNMYKNNEDYKILSLLQKVTIYYLLFLYENINKQISIYHNNKIIKNHSKLYQTEIFKFMSIPNLEPIKYDNNSISPFIEITNNLIEEINGSENNFNKINDDLINSINEINKELNLNQLNFLENYENQIKNINKIATEKQTLKDKIDENKYEILFYYFKLFLSKKNLLLNQIKDNENIDSLIIKIFLLAIKYYNCYDKLNELLKEVEKKRKKLKKI